MSEWKSIFEIWEKYSPYLRRDLMHREHLWNWAEKLGYTNLTSEKRVLNLFMDYLEEIKFFFPIHTAERGSEFETKRQRRRTILHFKEPSEKELKETIKYYHPFQFFQFILFWEDYLKNYTKESSFHHFLQEDSGDINKKKDQGIEARLSDKLYLKLVHSKWLTPNYLKIWIKIDSLFLFEDYIISPGEIDTDPILCTKSLFNKKEREEILSKFYTWRENIMEDKENFLTNSEKETFKHLYSKIYQVYVKSVKSSKNRINGLENWQDLIDMIPNQKLSKLYGNI